MDKCVWRVTTSIAAGGHVVNDVIIELSVGPRDKSIDLNETEYQVKMSSVVLHIAAERIIGWLAVVPVN